MQWYMKGTSSTTPYMLQNHVYVFLNFQNCGALWEDLCQHCRILSCSYLLLKLSGFGKLWLPLFASSLYFPAATLCHTQYTLNSFQVLHLSPLWSLSLFLTPSIVSNKTCFRNLTACPSQLDLFIFTNCTMSSLTSILSIPTFLRVLHSPRSYVGPLVFHTIFLSKTRSSIKPLPRFRC